MNLTELSELPESGALEYVTIVRAGKKYEVPKIVGTLGALWVDKDEPIGYVDEHGIRWMVGWHNGKRYKQRMR